jgi:hypothetical protein
LTKRLSAKIDLAMSAVDERVSSPKADLSKDSEMSLSGSPKALTATASSPKNDGYDRIAFTSDRPPDSYDFLNGFHCYRLLFQYFLDYDCWYIKYTEVVA